MTIQENYLVDEKGQKKSVVISIRDYIKLWQYLEDLEDAVDLKEAKSSAKDFIEFSALKRKLKKQGRIH